MHTTRLSSGRDLMHNGDFSGNLHIICAPGEVENIAGANGPIVRVTIPFEDLKEIVAEYVRGERISAAEQATTDELLGTA